MLLFLCGLSLLFRCLCETYLTPIIYLEWWTVTQEFALYGANNNYIQWSNRSCTYVLRWYCWYVPQFSSQKLKNQTTKLMPHFFNRLRVGMIYNIEVSPGGEGGAEHWQERATWQRDHFVTLYFHGLRILFFFCFNTSIYGRLLQSRLIFKHGPSIITKEWGKKW